MALEEEIRRLIDALDPRAAAVALIQAQGPQVLRLLRAVLGDRETAAVVFSRWGDEVWRGLPGARAAPSLERWGLGLAVLEASQHRDLAARRGGAAPVTGHAPPARGVPAGVSRQVERLRELLDVDERALLVLRIDQARSWEEIADILSSPGRALRAEDAWARFQRIKAKLGPRPGA